MLPRIDEEPVWASAILDIIRIKESTLMNKDRLLNEGLALFM